MVFFKKQINRMFLMSLVFTISLNLHAQKRTNAKNIFLRVYNLDGKKMSKGHVVFINDSMLGLNKGGKQVKVKMGDIGSIKTKRSAGHNILISSLAGGALGAISGATLFEPDPPESWFAYSRGDNAAIGTVLGVFAGAGIGSVTAFTKNSEVYFIDANIKKWLLFKELIENTRLN